MKNNFYLAAYFAGALGAVTSCHVKIPSQKTPAPAYYTTVDGVKVLSGYPKKGEPWVVISDRANNGVYMDKGDEKSPREMKFLEPLLVADYNANKRLIKVAEYTPDALMGKIPARAVKTYGWISVDQLLLWTNSVKNMDNGFAIKASLVPTGVDVLKNGEKYIKNDSVIVYNSPGLTQPTGKKIPVGQMVYVYKQAEENKRYLVGRSPHIKIDSVDQAVQGWVSANMVRVWGDRTALKVHAPAVEDSVLAAITKSGSDGAVGRSSLVVTDGGNRGYFENLVSVTPPALGKGNTGRYFTNALDYSNNYVYNIMGDKLFYKRFKEITQRNKNINIVFAVDASDQTVQHNSGLAKAVFQDLHAKIAKLEYYRNVKYGAVFYRSNTCGPTTTTSILSSKYSDITRFMERTAEETKCAATGGQPVQAGLAAAGDLLRKVRDETNIVVLIGASSAKMSMDAANRSLTAANAKIISFQSVSGGSDTYTQFVLTSNDAVSGTAKNIADLQKERITSAGTITNRNNYALVQGEEGYYALDYPKTSMTQGIVIYPAKGETGSPALLTRGLDQMLQQVTHQNKEIDKSLREAFRANASKTEVNPEFTAEFPNSPSPIPIELASQLVPYDNPFLTTGTYSPEFLNSTGVERGILLSESEYDQLRSLYMNIYRATIQPNGSFRQSSAVGKYLKVLSDYYFLPGRFDSNKVENNPMAFSVAAVTGFDNTAEEVMTTKPLREWKNERQVPQATAMEYFKQFKVLSEKLLENKSNPAIRFRRNGENFYWLNQEYMPTAVAKSDIE